MLFKNATEHLFYLILFAIRYISDECGEIPSSHGCLDFEKLSGDKIRLPHQNSDTPGNNTVLNLLAKLPTP
ncbi:hypothetical protein V1512DRAFT_261404 [Lipomyces arxii]|uniref:uncharacterized protein n=1 Tax=Lipomyces arxii TaxID=56418 RepID=UPI0034CF071D